MKKIKIIARANILPNVKSDKNDKKLQALVGYTEDVIEVEEECKVESIVLQFEEKYPETKGWNLEIKEID